ncbi:MAG: MATE family efflux transporter [Bacteroidales bacterium]|nr:MATE family efflux transporter [Bacteroidales bacterium]
MRKEILRLAIPNIISNISVPLLGIVDLALMGHLESELYINAIAIGGVIFSFIYLSFGFLRMGTTGFTAQAYGQNNEKESLLIFSRSLFLAFAIAALLILFKDLILYLGLQLLNSSVEVSIYASQYYNIRIFAAPATLGLYAIAGWFIGRQDTKTPLFLALLVNLANLSFNLIFIKLFHLKSDGVAWGTLLAQYLGFSTGIFLIFYQHRAKISAWNWREMLQKKALKAYFDVNLDIFIRTLILIASLSFFTSASARISDKVLAINTLLFQFFLFFSYFIDGFANAAEALVGKYIGNRNPEIVRKVIKQLLLWGAYISIPFSLVFFFFGRNIMFILTDIPHLISDSQPYFIWVGLIPILSFAAFIYDGIYIGATQAKAMRNSMFIASLIVYIPLFYLLRAPLGNHGLWIAFLAFLATRAILLSVWTKRYILI